MSIIRMSGIGVTAINGSVGTETFARNLYGTYVKTRIGAPGSSTYRDAWNAEVASITSLWVNTMTDSERETWYNLALRRFNAVGNARQVKGFQLFMSSNLNLSLIGQGPYLTAPESLSPSQMGVLSIIDASAASFTIEISLYSTLYFAIYVTKPLSPGRLSTNQIYFYLGSGIGTGVPYDLTTAYVARLGALTVGQKIFVKTVPIGALNGTIGIARFASAIVT